MRSLPVLRRLGALATSIALSALVPSDRPAAAQDGDEVIRDPELAGSPTQAEDGDEVIVDPELSGSSGTTSGGSFSASVPSDDDYDPQANTGVARIEAVGQFGADLRHEGGLEDAYETRLRLDTEVEFRRSRRLRVSLGVRTDLFWAVPSGRDPLLTVEATDDTPARKDSVFDQDRWELDIIPLSAYLDVTVTDGLHLRMGEQSASMGRMDFYSPIDMLAVFDLRGQPKLSPGIAKIAQPAIRMDKDLGTWGTLQVTYVPWFMPHLTRGNRDRYVTSVIGAGGDPSMPEPELPIDPSWQSKVSETGLRFVGPTPDFTTPQVAARLNIRGPGREIALSGGTALEKVPSIYTTPALEDYLIGRDGLSGVLQTLEARQPLLDVEYRRYYQVGLDGSFDLGPVVLGFEFAYSPNRQLYAAKPGGNAIPQPNTKVPITDWSAEQGSNLLDKSIRNGVPMVQGALHLEYLRNEKFGLIFEGFWLNALELPYDESRDWWGFIPGTGAFVGGLAGLMTSADDGRWVFNVSALGLVGPSVIVMPQIDFRAADRLYFNIAAQFFEGPAPTPGGGQNINLGGLLTGNDQVLFGFRYSP